MNTMIEIAKRLAGENKVYLPFLARMVTHSTDGRSRWPIFRYFSCEEFIGDNKDYKLLKNVDYSTYKIFKEDRWALDQFKIKTPVDELVLISCNMGSRLVISSSSFDFFASIDFHGNNYFFKTFSEFFSWEISQELEMLADPRWSGHIEKLISEYDFKKLPSLPFQ